jgi:hypothetical protein
VNDEAAYGNLDHVLPCKVLRAEPNNTRQIKLTNTCTDKLDKATHLALHRLSLCSVQCLDCEISSCHGSEYKDGCLPDCCAVWSDRRSLTIHRPDEGGSKHRWNVGRLVPHHTVQQPEDRYLQRLETALNWRIPVYGKITNTKTEHQERTEIGSMKEVPLRNTMQRRNWITVMWLAKWRNGTTTKAVCTALTACN